MLRPKLLHAVISLSLGALVCGCPDVPTDPPDSGLTCALPFLGDKTKAPEIEITARAMSGVAAPVSDGDTVAMILPLQGGRVIFAGVRVTNVDACAATLTGAIRDPTTMQVRLDARTINLKPVADRSGWGESDEEDISTFANVPVCPNQWSKTDIYGSEYELSIALTDREKRSVTKSVKVRPSCAEPDTEAECLCLCKGGYKLGEHCIPMVDAGANDGATDGGT